MINDSKKTFLVVRIEAVDIDKNEVYCVAKDNGRFTLKTPISDGIYRVPQVGESWVIRRGDLINWFFEGIVDSKSPYGGTTAEAGDVVIESANNVKVSAGAILVNNQPLGIWTHEEHTIPEEGAQNGQITKPAVERPLPIQNKPALLKPVPRKGLYIETKPAIKPVLTPEKAPKPIEGIKPILGAKGKVGLIELSGTPISTTIQVFNNGLLIAPSDIIISEQTLLFNKPLSPGKVVIFYMRLPE